MGNMTFNSIAKINENFANFVENLSKGETYAHTFEGVTGVITKYWNKGYGEAAKALNLGLDKPKLFKAYLKNLLKGEGLHESMYTHDNEGAPIIGVWGQKNLEDKTQEPIIDAKGKETFPYVKDEEGKNVKVDVIRPLASLTTKAVFTLILQNEALKAGVIPFTEGEGMEKYVINPAPVEVTTEEEPKVAKGLGKHTPKNTKKDKGAKAA